MWLKSTKVLGIKSLSKQIINKSFKPKLISKMSDEEAIIYLSNLRQVGRWSAEMILPLLTIGPTFGLFRI